MRKVQVTFYTTYMLFLLRIKASNIDVMKIRQSSQQKRMSKITSIIQYPNTAHQWLVNVYFTLVKSSPWHNITISQYQCHIQYHNITISYWNRCVTISARDITGDECTLVNSSPYDPSYEALECQISMIDSLGEHWTTNIKRKLLITFYIYKYLRREVFIFLRRDFSTDRSSSIQMSPPSLRPNDGFAFISGGG